MAPPDRPPAAPRAAATTLERRLPLLMTGVLGAGLAALLAVTYGTLTRRAEAITRGQLGQAAREVGNATRLQMKQREYDFRIAARDPALLAALRDDAGEGAHAAARAVLADLLAPRDSLTPIELWDAAGRPVASAGRAFGAAPPAPPAAAPSAPQGDALVTTSLGHTEGGRALYWHFLPVRRDGAVAGWIAQPHVFGARPDAGRLLRGLTGEELAAYVYNADGTAWTSFDGVPAGPPAPDDSGWGRRAGVGRVAVVAARVPETPWQVSFETPEGWIRAEPRRTLAWLAVVSGVVLLAGAAASWVIGQRITRPLRLLTRAAEGLASGTYEHPVPTGARDEVGRLASSFDAMARQVVAARAELEQRAEDAQAAAEALAAANARLRRITEDAERARADADRANRAKGDFLAMMSHELRTPLNAIGGYAELMAMGIHGPVTPAQEDALARVQRSKAHLLTLINDVLNFARIDAGQVRYAIAAVPLGESLAGVEALVAPQVRARRQTLTVDACDGRLAVRADPDKLRQLVLNLLGNAVKYTPEGGTITVSCDADPGRVRVHVRDSGPGIAPDRLASIFEPFVQGERALNRPDEGVGLGLAISRELAHGMGGTLTVASEVGRGSTFTVTLARAAAPADVAGAAPALTP
ncbi:HAMP domain-containing sensor histidine kinase [Roseisolibacter sp. H3M3-2]|uniref:sensor histidine kinase n=1 Tax=Roseisolibacter sp. H3M3-2 TaxID=3031323 RepID=UPI0023DCB972|nr:HAMP domain-containing sensor histidine kinase [Roseisolibacter sp. H3M3-2]MDF1501632.1 HAMP domain-containing sensor histidine kinase [Roseisolibacter sp. H3M3-2]